MNKKNRRIIISLGGSLIVPEEIDTLFLSKFKKLIETEIRKGSKFVLITGGGRTARRYAQAAKDLGDLNPDDLDWLGIHSTRLNAHLLRTIFRDYAHQTIITNPHDVIKSRQPVLIAAGYLPGWSTDYDAVVLARGYKASVVVNMSNIDYVYDKDPRKYKTAKPIKNINWSDFRKIVGDKWDPGAHVPFDPVAAKLAHQIGLKVVVLNGKDTSNLKRFIEGKKFIGSVIE